MDMLGRKVRDKITGFTGTATGYVSYITGCNQVLVAPQVKDDGSMLCSEWIDEQRIETLQSPRIVIDNGWSPGADRPAPKR